jgi:hypothetical protein
MRVIDIKENMDGSSTVELVATEKELNRLIEIGFNKILMNGILQIKEDQAFHYNTEKLDPTVFRD